MVYFVTTASLMITVGLCVLVGRSGTVFRSAGCSGLCAGLLRCPCWPPDRFTLSVPHCWRASFRPFSLTARSWCLLTGVLELAGAIGLLLPRFTRTSLCLSCRLNDRDLPCKCVWRQSDCGRLAPAQRAGSLSHAGPLHRAAANGRLGNPALEARCRLKKPQIHESSGVVQHLSSRAP